MAVARPRTASAVSTTDTCCGFRPDVSPNSVAVNPRGWAASRRAIRRSAPTCTRGAASDSGRILRTDEWLLTSGNLEVHGHTERKYCHNVAWGFVLQLGSCAGAAGSMIGTDGPQRGTFTKC